MMIVVAIVALVGLCGVGVLVFVLAGKRGVEVVSLKPPSPGQPALPPDASPEQLLRAGRKIEAIKRYRELTGVGLKEAKDAVEALEAGQPMNLPPKSTLLREVSDAEIEAHIRSGHLIDAIKLYREKNPGVGLKEAKDAVEAWRDRMRAS